ncbi:SAG-related sequence [Besnoitia besnoiti]|uniref:SAG-related sequence n=1 Tax=Besnoitia besnoiti TaxID=94643 RepID=A0A2A9MLB5_BESBE|nr:SAG-related sequence [Besnoitia besnoiti]PFH36806.1 SAG-related sequence [Besnoitia besnoiti]
MEIQTPNSARAPQRGTQRKSLLASRTRLTPPLLLATVTLLLYRPLLSGVGSLADETVKLSCETSAKRTKCTCVNGGATTETKAVSLSQTENEFEMYCTHNLTCAPLGLKDSVVCLATVESLNQCENDTEDKKNCMDVKQLLEGAPDSVKWTNGNAIPSQDTSKVLGVPQENFPYVDGIFSVGCIESNDTEKCRVNVVVKARATTTQDRKVICAYGTDSNQEHQTMTLSPSENSFTLVCGEKGEIVQKNYKETYCPVTEGKEAVTECAKGYKPILPAYEHNWWTGDEKQSFTLTIPKDAFPENDAKMTVQCQKRVEAGETAKAAPAAPSPTVCSVDVTIQGIGSSSAFSPPVHVAGLFGLGVSGVVAILSSLVE